MRAAGGRASRRKISKYIAMWRNELRRLSGAPFSMDVHVSQALLLALTALPIVFAFAVINRSRGFEILSAIEFGACAGLVAVAWMLWRKKRMKLAIQALVAIGALLFLSLFVLGGVDNTGIYWLPILPFISLLALGIRQGMAVASLILVAVAGISLASASGWMALPYTPWQTFIASLALAVFTFLAMGLALLQASREQQLVESLGRLRESEEELRRTQADLEIQVRERTAKLVRANKRLHEEAKAREKALEELREAQRNLFQAQKMQAIGTLVGGIAHDFNNMLSGITANLYMVQVREKDPEIIERLRKVDRLVMHAADMIRQMLVFARQDHVELRPLDLAPFLKEAFKLARVSIPESIECRLRMDLKTAPVKGDATQIQQMLMNLMNNARDALAGVERPEIEVSLRRFAPDAAFRDRHPAYAACEFAVLSVRDNGCGIPREKLDRIFEPFYSSKSTGRGTGLGLAMVYGAMQSHGGVIEVDSASGQGACFRLYFPLAEKTRGQESARAGSVARGNGEIVLVVDDDDCLREVVCEVLEHLGYMVLPAADGNEAVEIFRKRKGDIALVVMDLVMPGMGGSAAARKMQEIMPETPVVFMTGYDRHGTFDRDKAGKWGELIYKPVTVEDLSAAVSRALHHVAEGNAGPAE